MPTTIWRGDADDESIWRVFHDAGADLFHHLQVDAQKIVAAHAGLTRYAGCHDTDIRTFDRVIGIGAGQLCIETVNRRRLRNIKRFSLRNAFRDVEHDDVAELLEPDHVSERAADLA